MPHTQAPAENTAHATAQADCGCTGPVISTRDLPATSQSPRRKLVGIKVLVPCTDGHDNGSGYTERVSAGVIFYFYATEATPVRGLP